MAEKEERIFIGFINPEGDACPVPYGKCNSLCDNCKGGITRQEAIERMAKAIEYNLNGSSFNSLAEAILDALLGL